jgi:hypothetical protein
MLVSFEEFNSNFNSIHGVRVIGVGGGGGGTIVWDYNMGVGRHNVYLDEMLASSTFHPQW